MMIVDEKASIGSILEALREDGVKTSDVAKQIPGISEKPFRQALKDAGYVFNNKAPKGWHYVGTDPEPLGVSIFEFSKKQNKTISKKKIHSEFTTNSPTIHKEPNNTQIKEDKNPKVINTDYDKFTENEVMVLKDIIKFWKEDSFRSDHENLHDRVKRIKSKDKKRGTVVISKKVMDRLDDFCEKEDEDKSDILHLAIVDFIDKYEKKD